MPRTRLTVLLPVLGTAAFLLAVFPGCKSDSSPSTGVPTSITVTGKVISSYLQPLANLPVVITGRPATVTDANGSFTITDVTVPYDVTVVVSSIRLGLTYRGLTRSDPTLVNLSASLFGTSTATVSGTISGGGGYPEPATRVSSVNLSSAELTANATPNVTTGAYSMTPTWFGASTITTTLRALQWDKNTAGMPVTYMGYGEKTGVPITAGGTVPGQNIAMTAVSAQNISGTVTAPATFAPGGVGTRLSLIFPNNGSMSLGVGSGTGTFNYVIPVITGTTLSVTGSANGANGVTSLAIKAGIVPGTSGIAIAIPDPPTPILPVAAATNVTTTTPFSWTPLSSAIYVLSLSGPSNQPSYLLFTAGNTGTIPDLTALGLGLPKGASYIWTVMSYGPFADIDAAAGPNGLMPPADLVETASVLWKFTTAP